MKGRVFVASLALMFTTVGKGLAQQPSLGLTLPQPLLLPAGEVIA